MTPKEKAREVLASGLEGNICMNNTSTYTGCQTDFSVCPIPASKKSTTRTKTTTQRVLVVAHPDGFIEVYGEKGLGVYIATVPYVFSQRNEALALDCMEQMIPRQFREIYWPCNLRKREFISKANAAELLWREGNKQLVNTLNQINRKEGKK